MGLKASLGEQFIEQETDHLHRPRTNRRGVEKAGKRMSEEPGKESIEETNDQSLWEKPGEIRAEQY